jgi:hypothetical protein
MTELQNQIKAPVRALLGMPPPGQKPAIETMDAAGLVGAFLSRISIEPVQNSRLVDVGFVSADAQFAVRAVNAHAEERGPSTAGTCTDFGAVTVGAPARCRQF